MSVRFTLANLQFFTRELRTRFPFRYGIASMTEVPHLFVCVEVRTGNTCSSGLTAEGLPPKWFTKDPATTFAVDLEDLRRVIEHAASIAMGIARRPVTYFEFWQELSQQQASWAGRANLPPLLSNLGVSLCERVVLDGLARALEKPLHELIRDNALELQLGAIYPALSAASPSELLPPSPLSRIQVRHTLGLSDPLSPDEIAPGERVADGLPQDLESCVRAYGLRYFKIKLSGDPVRDVERLCSVKALLDRETGGAWFTTVDGNENFQSFDAFRDFWDRVAGDPGLHDFTRHLLVIEQPVHRDQALGDDAGKSLARWRHRPPLIIDESDGAIGDLSRALALGYAGTSHKNCKGIVKGLANACLLALRRRTAGDGILTGEDLCNLGPVAVLQDLAMMTTLGIQHVERNGHHYYRGLSMWPAQWQESTLASHPDVYTRHRDGFPVLRIEEGELALASVNEAPFGVRPQLDPALIEA